MVLFMFVGHEWLVFDDVIDGALAYLFRHMHDITYVFICMWHYYNGLHYSAILGLLLISSVDDVVYVETLVIIWNKAYTLWMWCDITLKTKRSGRASQYSYNLFNIRILEIIVVDVIILFMLQFGLISEAR